MIRPARPSDLNFVKASWFDSFALSPIARSLLPSLYKRSWSTLIDRLVESGTVLIDADSENTDVILGWVCWDGLALHYVFVRPEFRCEGRARQLIEAAGSPRIYTHRTTDWQQITARWQERRLTYDPTRAWAHFAEIAPVAA